MRNDQFVGRLARSLFALGVIGALASGCAGTNQTHTSSQANPASEVPGANQLKFAVLSDLHFNPFLCSNQAYTNLAVAPSDVSWPDTFAAYEAGTGGSTDHRKQDSSYYLIKMALRSVTNRCANPAFVLCTGDYFAHERQIADELRGDAKRFDEYQASYTVRSNYVVNSEAMVARMLASVGLTNVFPTLGNNDAVGDYAEPDSNFLAAFAAGWSVCTPPGTFSPEFQKLGCFAATPPGWPGCRILEFNTSLFSTNGLPSEESAQTIAWLTDELSASPSRTLLLYHIPPGPDFFGGGTPLWKMDLQDQFLKLLADNHDKIIGSFCSHTHDDEVRLLYSGDKPVHYFHISPSISPVHGNSPAYQIFTVSPGGQILGYTTYYLSGFPGPGETWQREYAFSNFTADPYNENTLARLFFSEGSDANRDAFHVHYFAPGILSTNYDSAGYWRMSRLDAPIVH
jgi:hypothetical protein